ncbi:hypothetical protein [Flavobacterium sp. FlaQc-48]|uniref:hypothetical protein n=1 Tax=Flavobacterium sp. FlaQc-48 TaxID=3374181 RepID=UPI003757F069
MYINNRDYLLQLAPGTPHYDRLEKAINDLLYFVEAGAVYVSFNDVTNVVVTFILKEDCSQDGDMLAETLHKRIEIYPDFIFKFINSNWATYGFRKKKPYFIQHCTLKELVYFDSDSKLFYPDKNISKQLIKKAKKRFCIDFEAAVVSFRNISVYSRNSKTIEAAFALHQTLRYVYICASEFLTPQFISSTCLLMHYDYLIDFAPSLKKIINIDIEADKEILVLLNAAYTCTLQNQIMKDIDTAFVARAKVKVELMQKEINRLFTEYTKLCVEKSRELAHQNFIGKSIFNDKIRSNYIIENALAKISTALTEAFSIRTIYCFGYATIHTQVSHAKNSNYSKNLPEYHFYLLVVNLESQANAISSMQNLIRTRFEGKYKVTVLNHSSNYVRKKNQNQKYFFDHIIVNGLLVYNNPLYLVYVTNLEAELDFNFSKKYVENRILIAKQLFSLAQNCFNDDSAIIKKVLFCKTIEQIAIGLIYLFLGYHSAKFSINYLFSLLKYIKEVELPFDFKDEKEKALYQFMTENPKISKQREVRYDGIENNRLLELKCSAFIQYAIDLTENAFEKLENGQQ